MGMNNYSSFGDVGMIKKDSAPEKSQEQDQEKISRYINLSFFQN
jgi:hypothetical protein